MLFKILAFFILPCLVISFKMDMKPERMESKVEGKSADLINAIQAYDKIAVEISGHPIQAKRLDNVTSESRGRNQCQDSAQYASNCPDWKWACTDPRYVSFMQNNCKKSCGLCSVNLYGVGTDHGVWWTVPNKNSWSKLRGGGWVSRIIIHGDKIYGIGSDKAIWSRSVHDEGSWTKITDGLVRDLAYWNGRLYGVGLSGGVFWTVPNGSWRKLSGGGWVSRIVIHGDTIYGIGGSKAIHSRSVHNVGSWTKITPGSVIDLAYWNGQLFGVGTDHGVWWTVPNKNSWSKLGGGGWVSRIVIHGDKIYGIGSDKAIWSRSVHDVGSWTKITSGSVIDLAYWNGK